MKIYLKFHNVADRDKWLAAQKVHPVAHSAGGEAIRFVSAEYTLESPINDTRIVHGEWEGPR